MKRLATGIFAAAVAGILVIGAMERAEAAAYAASSLNITDFNVSGIPAFSSTSFTLTGNKAQLGAATLSNGPLTSSAASLNLDQLCLDDGSPACAPAENALTTLIGNTPGKGSFARGDSHMLDTVVNETSAPGATGDFGGVGEARSKDALASSVALGADGPDNQLSWTFFVAADANAADTDVTFAYDAQLIFKIIRDATLDLAKATSVFRIVINDESGDEVGSITDATLNRNVTKSPGSNPAVDIDDDTGVVAFLNTITIPDASEGQTFELDVIFANTALADSVPEPSVLLVLGTALVGVAAIAHRRLL